MKLASFIHENMESFGIVTDKGVIDLKRCIITNMKI